MTSCCVSRFLSLVALCIALIVVGAVPQERASGRCGAAAAARLRRHLHRRRRHHLRRHHLPPPAPLTEDELFQRKTLDQLNAERPLGDVFFDLDQSEVRADARTALQTNADWMKKWTGTQVMLEGHADSRGSSEYNLALGTRRANSVRDYLVSLGVPAARITVVSKGKEAPFCKEENEACWQQNRRGHFVITAK